PRSFLGPGVSWDVVQTSRPTRPGPRNRLVARQLDKRAATRRAVGAPTATRRPRPAARGAGTLPPTRGTLPVSDQERSPGDEEVDPETPTRSRRRLGRGRPRSGGHSPGSTISQGGPVGLPTPRSLGQERAGQGSQIDLFGSESRSAASVRGSAPNRSPNEWRKAARRSVGCSESTCP